MPAFPLLPALLCWTNPAWAGVALVPTSPLIADGTTTSTVRLYVDTPGTPRAKIKSDTGKIGPIVAGADGVVTFQFTPAAATAAGTVPLSVTINGEAVTIVLPVVPPLNGHIAITADPAVLSSLATATIHLDPGPGSAPGRTFKVTASVGKVDAITPTGSGTWEAHYTPPAGMTAPVSVVISAVDAAAPGTVWGVATLPVETKRSVSFDAQAGSSNVLVVGDRTYGPVVAAPSGKVAFSVDLDPRQPKGHMTSIHADTSKEEKDVDMEGVAPSAIAWLAGPAVVPAGAVADLRVATTVTGGLNTASAPTITATGGSSTTPLLDGTAFDVKYTAPTTPGDVTVTATVGAVKTDLKIHVVAAPGSMTLTMDPAEIAANGTSVKVTARVKDAGGAAVTGHAPTLSVEGGSLGALSDNHDGSYTGTIKLDNTKTNLVRVWGVPSFEPTGLAPIRILVWPSASTAAANGTDAIPVTVLAVDAFGIPVPNLDLKLSVPHGDGSLPPDVKTDAHGLGRTTFRAGKGAGLVTLRVEGAGLWAEAPIVQAASGGASATIPVGGPPDVDALIQRWRDASPETLAIRAGTAPLSGPPAAVTVATVPPYTTPGANILVTVHVSDSTGKGVPGQKLAVTASPASVSAITDNHDGSYTFTAQLPAGVDGPIAISVGAASAVGQLNLPTLANAAATGAPVATAAGTPAAKVKKVHVPLPATQFHKLHLGVMLDNAHGSYTMTANGQGGLIGGAKYNAPALGFTGLRAELEFWPVHTKIGDFGVEGDFDSRIELYNALGTTGVDLARDVIGGVRYRRAAGPWSYGGGLDVHYTAGNVFLYTPDFKAAKATALPLLGARVDLLGGLESKKIYAGLEAHETFVPFPSVTRLGGFFQFAIKDDLGIRLGAAWEYRSMKIDTADCGGPSDTRPTCGHADVVQSQAIFDGGVGWMF